MNELTVESMVTHLVQCSCNGFIDYPKSYEKAPDEARDIKLYKHIAYDEEYQGKAPMKWNSILKDLLPRCPQFCRDELVFAKTENAARWPRRDTRKVLAPLGFKHNTENIIAGSLDMSRKRKADTNSVWLPTKRAKLDDPSNASGVYIQRTPLKDLLLQYKCVRDRSFVKLYDIIKEIPQVKEEVKPVAKNDFMEFLGLDSPEPSCKKKYSEVKTNRPVKLLSHPHIPFSSDYGQRLLARECHYLPPEVTLRKIERTEWYLKGTTPPMRNTQQPQITYDCNYKKPKHTHIFKYPRRQFHQTYPSLQQAFSKYVCKPASIHLEQIDLSRFWAEKQNREQQSDSTVIIIDDSEDEDVTCTPQLDVIELEEEEEVVTIDCPTLLQDCSCDVQQQSDGNEILYEHAQPKLISEPRRSLRLNYTKS